MGYQTMGLHWQYLPVNFTHQIGLCHKVVGCNPGRTLLNNEDEIAASLGNVLFIEQQRLPQLRYWPNFIWNVPFPTYKHHHLGAATLITAFQLSESIIIADDVGVETEVTT
jgi:hypothetical protein